MKYRSTILLPIVIVYIGAMAQAPLIKTNFNHSHKNENITNITDTTGRKDIIRLLQQGQATTNNFSGYPEEKQIQRDLVGHSLAEGVTNGYYSEDWYWEIEDGQISQLRITEIIQKTQTQYLLIAQMRLSKDYYSYNAKVKIKYILTSQNHWVMDYVVSLGMHIVNTHEYDDYIRSSIVEDGWGGTFCVKITNQSELSLAVGGDFLTNNGWRRYLVRVPPHGIITTGGLFNGGSVSDYRINFVMRINEGEDTQ